MKTNKDSYILLVDKPKGITSNKLIKQVQRKLNVNKIGHAGTLDPNATGLMILLINKATKLSQYLIAEDKQYIAKTVLGIETNSLDIDGYITNENTSYELDISKLKRNLKSFIGTLEQVPPIVSAIKVNGKKLLNYALENKEVTIKKRTIKVYDLTIEDIFYDQITLKTKVSKGTYVRTLIYDLIKKSNLHSTLIDLRRTASGIYNIEDAVLLEEINNNVKKITMFDFLKTHFPCYEITQERYKYVINGAKEPLSLYKEDKVVLCKNNKPIAIYKREEKYYKVETFFGE